jgi:signal transduction histidine kinase/DNA-binding response OmpR family regulator
LACDGTKIIIRVLTVIPPDFQDTWSRVLMSLEDVTERVRAREALEQSESRYREIFDQSPVALLEEDWRPVKQRLRDLAARGVRDFTEYFRNHPGELTEAYEAARRYGISRAAVELYRASSVEELRAGMTGDAAEADELTGYGEMIAAFYDGAESFEYEAEEVACDGTEIITRIRVVIPPGHRESWARVFVTIEDITRHRYAEAQLRQAQRLQAVGQLTGGLAHDFNNILAVILGNAELLEEGLGADDACVKPILRAASRGADLTQQLLSFARRQTLEPRAIEVYKLVDGLMDMITRVLDETIAIRSSVAPDLWPVFADPGQLENAILNLVINARDAMPNGGNLVIDACNATRETVGETKGEGLAEAGFIELSVIDDGSGMTAETLEFALEPFYTTKEVGKGSGLGLSMVYGFAEQSGGFVDIASEPGSGTTVKLLLPRARAVDLEVEDAKRHEPFAGGGETVVVLEDDPDVRELAVKILGNLGYQVFQAETAQAAEIVFDYCPQIDLLLSDVVLPGGVSGPDFAKQARRRYPGLGVLFMSGYALNAAEGTHRLEPGDELIGKPFSTQELAAKVRARLDRGALPLRRPLSEVQQQNDAEHDQQDPADFQAGRALLEENSRCDEGEDQLDLPKGPHIGRVLQGHGTEPADRPEHPEKADQG